MSSRVDVLNGWHGSLTREAARLVRREHSQVDDDAIEEQGRAGMAIKRAGDALRARVAELEAEVERLRGLDTSLPGFAEVVHALNSLITDENGKILIRSMRYTEGRLHEERADLAAARETIKRLEAEADKLRAEHFEEEQRLTDLAMGRGDANVSIVQTALASSRRRITEVEDQILKHLEECPAEAADE